MKEVLYELYKKKGASLTKSDVNNCDGIKSYNTLNRLGLSLNLINGEFKERLYNENPKYCIVCEKKIIFSKDILEKKFCGSSCSAKHSNVERAKPPISVKCKQCCSVFTTKRVASKFCSKVCANLYRVDDNVRKWLSGQHKGWVGQTKQLPEFVRRYIHKTRGTACEQCGWDEKHPDDNGVLTEIDHIDGNAENGKPSNLRILCPNCHSMTPTFRARNKNSTRVRKKDIGLNGIIPP